MNKTIFVPLASAFLLLFAVGCSEREDDASKGEPTDIIATGIVTEHIPHGETESNAPAVTTADGRTTGGYAETTTSGGYRSIYDQLTAAERDAYDELLDGIIKHEKLIYLTTRIEADSLYKVYEALLLTACADGVYLPRQYKYSYSTSTGCVISVELTYEYTVEQIERMNVKLEKSVGEIMAKLTKDMSDEEKIRILHDSIISGCVYSSDGEYTDNAYGALVDGKAVCEGYSHALMLLCKRAGIKCILVTGYAGEEHMWNMVEISGKWYHVDVTWDDPSFADGREDFVSYTYLALSDALILRDHTVDAALFDIPAAKSDVSNYYVYNKLYATSSDEAQSLLAGAMKRAAQGGLKSVSIRLSDSKLYKSVNSALFDTSWSGMFELTEKVNRELELPITKSSLQVYRDDTQYVIRISFSIFAT